jgi:hypothetical protein
MKENFLRWKGRYWEEFLFGFFIPILIILIDWLMHFFGFLYYFFPAALVIGFAACLITKKWGAALGIVAFVVFAFIIRGFFPAFWGWVAADKKLFSDLIKLYV